MLCEGCKKNQAIKTKEQIVEGKRLRRYYCADCFHARFLSPSNSRTLAKCPYCGTTKEGAMRSGLVGCAHCYQAFEGELLPVVIRMQGDGTHAGKEYEGDRDERLRARCEELQTLIRVRQREKDVEKVRLYSQEYERVKGLIGGGQKVGKGT